MVHERSLIRDKNRRWPSSGVYKLVVNATIWRQPLVKNNPLVFRNLQQLPQDCVDEGGSGINSACAYRRELCSVSPFPSPFFGPRPFSPSANPERWFSDLFPIFLLYLHRFDCWPGGVNRDDVK